MKDENPVCVSVSKFDHGLNFAASDTVAAALREFVLIEAFLDRTVTLIAWETSHYSQPEFDSGQLLSGGADTFRAVNVDACPRDLLSRIASAWDFEINMIWIMLVSAVSDSSLIELVNSIDVRIEGRIDGADTTELIVANDDGMTLLWWNPSVSMIELVDLLRRFSNTTGCNFEIAE